MVKTFGQVEPKINVHEHALEYLLIPLIESSFKDNNTTTHKNHTLLTVNSSTVEVGGKSTQNYSVTSEQNVSVSNWLVVKDFLGLKRLLTVYLLFKEKYAK